MSTFPSGGKVAPTLPKPHRYFGGRPPCPTELMIRLLAIQQLLNLSDVSNPDTRQSQPPACPLRLRLWRSARLQYDMVTSSIGWFKPAWEPLGFYEVNRQLQVEGYLARCGQTIDLTLSSVEIPL